MDESDPPDEAFCTILWQANGGRVTSKGLPIFEGEPIRGHCKEPGDCDGCEHMQRTLVELSNQGVRFLWICPACAALVHESAETMDIAVTLAGYYTQGYCQRPQCYRGEVWGDQGRYSSLLQLITFLGDIIP